MLSARTNVTGYYSKINVLRGWQVLGLQNFLGVDSAWVNIGEVIRPKFSGSRRVV